MAVEKHLEKRGNKTVVHSKVIIDPAEAKEWLRAEERLQELVKNSPDIKSITTIPVDIYMLLDDQISAAHGGKRLGEIGEAFPIIKEATKSQTYKKLMDLD